MEIHDTGPGMTAVEFDRACVREVRLEKTRGRAEGMGYGLSIVSALAKKHALGVSVAPGRRNGTGIIVEVPAQAWSCAKPYRFGTERLACHLHLAQQMLGRRPRCPFMKPIRQ